jgi:hypothetical protein
MNTTLLRNIALTFLVNLAWVAGIMYVATKFNPFNAYLALALYWVLPLSAYLLLLYRSGWMTRMQRGLRVSFFGAIGFGLSLSAVVAAGTIYSLFLSHALSNL